MTDPAPQHRAWRSLFGPAVVVLAALATALLYLPSGAARAGFGEGWLLGGSAYGQGQGFAYLFETTRGELRRPLFWAATALCGDAATLHATAAILHALTFLVLTLLVVHVLARRPGGTTWTLALAFALAWAASPARVEAVADGAAFGAPLGALFASLAASFWFLAQTTLKRPHATVLVSAGFFALALLADPSLFPLPIALMALRAWIRRDTPEPRPSAGGSLATLWMAACLALVSSLACREPGGEGPLLGNLVAAGSALVRPIRAVLSPLGLHPAHDPPAPFPERIDVSLWIDAATAVALIAACVVGVRRRRGWGYALAAHLALAAGPLLLTRAPVGSDVDAYVATMPLYLAAAVAVSRLPVAWKRVATVAAAVLATGSGLLTKATLTHWTSEEALAEHVIQLDPTNERAHVAIGDASRRAGVALTGLARWYGAPLAQSDFRPLAHARLGASLLELGDAGLARRHLERAVAIAPWLPAARFDLGSLELREGRLESARGHLEAASRLDAESADAWRLLARVRDALGDLPGAVDAISRAAAKRPDDAALAEELRRLSK